MQREQNIVNKILIIIVLQTSGYRGIEKMQQTVILKNNQLIVNGNTLSQAETLIKTTTLKKLLYISKNEMSTNCVTGTYKHLVKIAEGKEQLETGCLESARYTFLLNNFKIIKKDILLE
jgi:hypothetical protein